MRVLLLACLAWLPLTAAESTPTASTGVRLKDLCDIDGVRDNQLNGVGVVVGLSGTGDKSPGVVRMLRQILDKKKGAFTDSDLSSKNVALVSITADLPAFKQPGDRIPINVACLGDAASLRGGILIAAPLTPSTSETVYAVAQGPVSIGGFGQAGPAIAGGGTPHTNLETVGTIAQGALVEREVPMSMLVNDRLSLKLRQADFTTASRVARLLADTFGTERVVARDAQTISLLFPEKPAETVLVTTIAQVMELRVDPDMKARVVINSRTGTIVAGHDVRISPVAVSHAGLSLRIQPRVATVANQGPTTVWNDPVTNIKSTTTPAGTRAGLVPGTLTVIEGASVEDIANGLNALGARPRDLVAIFQAIQSAGALHAELVEM